MRRPEHLIFLHIPKTAGTTLHDIIHRQFRPEEMFSLYNIRKSAKFTSLPEEQRNAVKMLKGHLPYGIHSAFTKGETEYFTILREPVDRVISNYFHCTVEKMHPFYTEFHEKKYTIKQLVESGRIPNMNNCMVRFFSGEFDRAYDQCDEAMLEKALQHLDGFALVGLNESFDIFLLRLMERYRFRNPYYRRRRVSSTRMAVKDLDKETAETIRYYNRLDIELYRIMKEKVEQEQRALGDAFLKKVERFRSMNRFLNKVAKLVPFI
jgi:hypothetical protein